MVDDAIRLKEIRGIVKNNNSSSLEGDLIICQIYMESRFDAESGKGVHSARGLMQMQKNAVRQIYKYRVQKATGHMPSDAATQKAFAEADVFYNSENMYDEAENVKIGTEYMQYWMDKNKNNVVEAYKDYRGGTRNGIYYNKIKSCADKLKLQPNNMQLLRDMVKVK
ncbi:lytic transglycosylase domain-containing protein [Salmonella enterica subsp. enterica serovar Omuna]|nr:lytic transglycosylase domain-containing protein [Salmonella enterica subsp. enterica serovar Omuna]